MASIPKIKNTKCSYVSVPETLRENCVELRNDRIYNELKKIQNILKRVLTIMLIVFLVISLVVYVVVPVSFKYSSSFRRMSVFQTMVDLPSQNNYSNLAAFGLKVATNFYLKHNGIKLGVWHILPSSLATNDSNASNFEESLIEHPHIVLYNHGNSGSRGTSYRLDMYEILRKKFHVITYDYRGFGDSTGEPRTEKDVIEDGVFIAHWVLSKLTPDASFFLWGHSLGSSVALAITRALRKENIVPTGLVLESSFHNGREAVSSTPTCQFFSFLPWFETCLIDPIMENEGDFSNHEYISDADCPILIIHSRDDHTILFKYGKKLYDEAGKKRSRAQGMVEFVAINEEFNCGHNHLSRAPDLPEIIDCTMKLARKDPEHKEWWNLLPSVKSSIVAIIICPKLLIYQRLLRISQREQSMKPLGWSDNFLTKS